MSDFENKLSVTRAQEKLRKADFHTKAAAKVTEELRLLILNHPEHALMQPAQYVRHTALCLLLLAPFLTEPLLEQQTINDLLSKYLGVTSGAARAIWTILIVGVQTFIIWALSFVGSARNGLTGLVLRAMGLLTAAAIPVMVISTTLAQADIESLKNLSEGQAAAPSWSQTLKENMHLVVLSFFSLALHCLIWVEASEILESLGALAIARKAKVLKARLKSHLTLAEELTQESAALVSAESTMREIFEREFPQIPSKPQPHDPGKNRLTDKGDKNDNDDGASGPSSPTSPTPGTSNRWANGAASP